MKDTIFIGGLCVIIVLVGAGLYFYKPSYEAPTAAGAVTVEPYADGQYAIGMDTRKNFRIQSQEELDHIWTLIHGNERPSLPPVDFSKNEVLAVFDGTHTTGGYQIKITEVVDSELTRTVHIEHLRPDDSCPVPSVATSPYALVVVPKMRDALRLTHTDGAGIIPCR